MPDIFDRIKLDVFDRIKLDVFDRIELDSKEKIIFSKEMGDLLKEEFQKQLAKIPIGQFVADVIKEEMSKRQSENEQTREAFEAEIAKAKDEMRQQVDALKKESDTLGEKLKEAYAGLKNEIFSRPVYEFGGFSPQTNDLNIGDPLADGNWRIVRVGSNLSVQNRVAGSWAEVSAFAPNV